MIVHPDRVDPAVTVDGLVKRYGDVTAVDDVTFHIERGECFALLGPNGAGKSTTIEILEGYRTRTAGELRVLGADPSRAGLDWKSRLGIMLQSTGDVGVFSVTEILQQFATLYPNPRPVDEVIEMIGLPEKAKARVSKLSGGQKRRVDVGLAIIGRPELVFLDEPTTGFDPQARRQFWDTIRTLQREQTTILLTTHYLDEAAQLADRVGVIARGKLVALDSVQRLGGPDARTPRVRWIEDGETREVRTHTPAAFARKLGDEPEGLEVIRPSLEDIYLELVGHESEDAAAAGSEPNTADVTGAAS